MRLLRTLFRPLPFSSIVYSSIKLPKPFIPRHFSYTRILTVDMETVNTTERLKLLREVMKDNDIEIYGRG